MTVTNNRLKTLTLAESVECLARIGRRRWCSRRRWVLQLLAGSRTAPEFFSSLRRRVRPQRTGRRSRRWLLNRDRREMACERGNRNHSRQRPLHAVVLRRDGCPVCRQRLRRLRTERGRPRHSRQSGIDVFDRPENIGHSSSVGEEFAGRCQGQPLTRQRTAGSGAVAVAYAF